MIAHAPVTPLVIPLFHTGMADIMPLNPFTKKILHAFPRQGKTVTARAGPAIMFEDLIEEHERRHGPLRKLSVPIEGGAGAGAGVTIALRGSKGGDGIWSSTPEERQLYSNITRRVEEALLKLEAEARRDLGDDFPQLPPEPTEMLRLAREVREGQHDAHPRTH